MSRLEGATVVVVGGGSGIGKAIAKAAAAQDADLVLSSRNAAKLADAAATIGGAQALSVDMTDAASVGRWADGLPAVDHLVVSASSAYHGTFAELPEAQLRAMFDAKFFGPYAIARAALPKLRDGGSITFFSGVLSRRPSLGCSGLGAVNGAVESLTYALALELAPALRVNCVSPGMVRSDAYAQIDAPARKAMYETTGASLPVDRVGTVEEAADAALFLMTNAYATGLVLDIDGGHRIRR